MRKLITIAFVLAGLSAGAQQLTQYSHYVLNYFAMNPAVAGSSPCLDMKLGYRRQWAGIEGAPSSAFANLHGNFGKKKHNFHGLGGQVESDDAGPLSYTSMAIAYAYHLKVSRKYMLSLGVSAGFMQYRIDAAGLVLPDVQFGNDPAFTGASSDFVLPIVNTGLWLYSEDRFYGFAIRNVSNNQVEDIGLATRIVPHFSFTHGRAIEMNDGFMFKPSAQLKYVGSSRLSIDANAMIDYKSKVELGLGFRSESGLVGLFRVDLFKYVTLAYAYDHSLSRMRLGGRHSHEIVLGIKACALGESRATHCAAYD